MATPSTIVLRRTASPFAFTVPGAPAPGADEAAARVLQLNHDRWHIFYHQEGFHNHIAHHILTIYALGASPETIKSQYDLNVKAMRPHQPIDQTVITDMHDPENYKKYLGQERYYHDFLLFFQAEMEAKGYEAVVNEYILQGDKRADDMLVRMYSGFLHPIIHLGFGIEFAQPAIIAEALAQAAVHDGWIAKFFHGTEAASRQDTGPGKSLVALIDEIHADEKLVAAPHWDDGNKIRDGILKRAPEEMIKYASQWHVSEANLEEELAEMVNAAVFFSGAAQHPPKQIKFDFYFMHCVNSSIFFSVFLTQPWISKANKVRLLQWKGWVDLCMYTSRASPVLRIDEITRYQPQKPEKAGWNSIFERAATFRDDGHASKLVRALAHGEQVSSKWETGEAFRIKGEMWLKLGNMAIDSVESEGRN